MKDFNTYKPAYYYICSNKRDVIEFDGKHYLGVIEANDVKYLNVLGYSIILSEEYLSLEEVEKIMRK